MTPETWAAAGVLGDGLPTTMLTASQANIGGSPLAITLATAYTALTARAAALGTLDFASLVAKVAAGVKWTGTSGVVLDAAVLVKIGSDVTELDIDLPEISGNPSDQQTTNVSAPLTPAGLPWTAALVDTVTIAVQATVTIPPASSAELRVSEASVVASPRDRAEVACLAGESVVECEA